METTSKNLSTCQFWGATTWGDTLFVVFQIAERLQCILNVTTKLAKLSSTLYRGTIMK